MNENNESKQAGAEPVSSTAGLAAEIERLREDGRRLDWLEANKADVEAPEPPDSRTWVIYTPGKALGAGAGCAVKLREAIDRAMKAANVLDQTPAKEDIV